MRMGLMGKSAGVVDCAAKPGPAPRNAAGAHNAARNAPVARIRSKRQAFMIYLRRFTIARASGNIKPEARAGRTSPN